MPNDYNKIYNSIIGDPFSSIKPPENFNTAEEIIQLLSQITDPEIPVINIQELGILRSVEKINDVFEIVITPTYVACPAMGLIEMQIKALLDQYNIKNYSLKTILSPSWTTDWISESGKTKLKEYGIAPPVKNQRIQKMFESQGQIECPRCASKNTNLLSEFSSTACKSMYKCEACLETFEYFKCH